jgi:hypothetical protein
MPATPLINGINYSWANVQIVLFGVPVVGITKIAYKRKQKKENNYGFGSQPVSRGYGNEEYEGSIELYVDEWQRIIAASPNRNPNLIPPFDIQVLFSGQGVQTNKHILRSVEFMEDDFDAKQGDTKLNVSIPLIIGLIEK